MADITITGNLAIPESEVRFEASRSGGPGGQNVNKVNTRIELYFDVANSASLSPWQRQRILGRLANRIDKEGVLRVVSQNHRSQKANRDDALERFVVLLSKALHRPRKRIPTTVPRAARKRRLEQKRRHSRKKKERRWTPDE